MKHAHMLAMPLQEIELLRSLSFDGNIVQFYGACLQEENTMMVLEYMAVSTTNCSNYSCNAVFTHQFSPQPVGPPLPASLYTLAPSS